MDLSLPGVIHAMAVAVRQFEISSTGACPIQATGQAFAAILEDGCVVTGRGDAAFGGVSSAVRADVEKEMNVTRSFVYIPSLGGTFNNFCFDPYLAK